MTKRILITGAGGGGSNNLIEDILMSKLDFAKYELVGSNLKPEVLIKSPLKENYLLPVATSPEYKDTLVAFIKEKKIDLIIPNNDREVGMISELRSELPCKVFLPQHETILNCQDKHLFYLALSKHNIPMAVSYEIKSPEDIRTAMEKIGGAKFWIRPKKGSGSRGATWVYNDKQALSWINLWIELRGYKISDFTVSEFLPGRDYCFQSVWNNGKLIVAKMCERLSYFNGDNHLSGMSSTPAIAKTIKDDKALEIIFKSIHALSDAPHGNFSFDLKGNSDGEMCVTECNIGRFCMITPMFDRTGKYNCAEMYIRCAFNDNIPEIKEPVDIEENRLMLRELDTLPLITWQKEIDQMSSYSFLKKQSI